MTDMLERAAKAAFEQCEAYYCQPRTGLNDVTVDGDMDFVAGARAALLAALDPEDEALVNEVARAIGLMDYYGEEPMPTPSAPALRVTKEKLEHFAFLARAAIAALKASAAQGERDAV